METWGEWVAFAVAVSVVALVIWWNLPRRRVDLTWLKVVAIIAMLPIAAIMYGWAFSVLWGWFFVPLFNLPEVSVFAGIGIAMTVRLLLPSNYDPKKYEGKDFADVLGDLIGLAVGMIITVLMGAVVHALV
jgi:hypothetical protein